MTSQITLRPQLLPATDEEVAGAYACAYASADVETLRDLLAPDVVCRLLMPGGVQELQGAEAFVDALVGAVSGVDGWRFHSSSAAPIGDKFVTRSRVGRVGHRHRGGLLRWVERWLARSAASAAAPSMKVERRRRSSGIPMT